MKLDSAPWTFNLSNDDYYNLTVKNIAGGEKPTEILFDGRISANNPSCKEIADLVSEVYALDQIVIYREKTSDSNIDMRGYEKTDDYFASILGEPMSRSVADRPYV